MFKLPQVPHQDIVNYILAGHTTREAKDYFGFSSDNIANLRVHAAFKRVGVPRPRYQKSRACEFCQSTFMARDHAQRTCGSPRCQKSLILDWHRNNREKGRGALSKYRLTDKARENYKRRHRKIRDRGLTGLPAERWYFASFEIKKSLRKLTYLHLRNPWECRIHQVQRVASLPRQFNPRKQRRLPDSASSPGLHVGQSRWTAALRSVQTILFQYASRTGDSQWEQSVTRIGQALKSRHATRTWKRSLRSQ